jgi:Fe-S-cluster containining protein
MALLSFACTACGDCCRGFSREATDWEPERGPVVRLSQDPGLPLLSWEWHRLRRIAAEQGLAPDVAPFDGVLDLQGGRVVVLSYRLRALACPFLADSDAAPGPRSAAWGFARGGTCTVYEHRPLACRAFPLVPMRNGIALSLHCPEVRDADPASADELRGVYGASYDAALRFRAAPDLAVRLVEDLEAAGRVRIARDALALAREVWASWPLTDVCDLATEHGLGAWQDLEARARAGTAQAH